MEQTWNVTVRLSDADDPRPRTYPADPYPRGTVTTARAELVTAGGTRLHATTHARRALADLDAPEVGEELAVARALRELADRLVGPAEDDLPVLARREVVARS